MLRTDESDKNSNSRIRSKRNKLSKHHYVTYQQQKLSICYTVAVQPTVALKLLLHRTCYESLEPKNTLNST